MSGVGYGAGEWGGVRKITAAGAICGVAQWNSGRE